MSLVKGFTDILTPINILPNNTFKRGGGLASTLTYSSITAEVNVNIAEGWQIMFKTSVTNVSITREHGTITVTGHTDTLPSDYFIRIWNNTKNMVVDKHPYTFIWNTVSKSNNIGYITGSANSSLKTVYYSHGTGSLGKGCSIISHDSATHFGIYIGLNETGDFSLCLRNLAVYDGLYTDPPYFRSLDDVDHNVFALYNGQNLTLNSDNLMLPSEPDFHMSCKDVTSVTTKIPDISGYGHDIKATNSYVSLLTSHQGIYNHETSNTGSFDSVGGTGSFPVSGFSGFTLIWGGYLRNYVFTSDFDLIRISGSGVSILQLTIKSYNGVAVTSRSTSSESGKGLSTSSFQFQQNIYTEIAAVVDFSTKECRVYTYGKYIYGQTKAYSSTTSNFTNGHILGYIRQMDLMKLKVFCRPLSDIEIFTEYVVGSR